MCSNAGIARVHHAESHYFLLAQDSIRQSNMHAARKLVIHRNDRVFTDKSGSGFRFWAVYICAAEKQRGIQKTTCSVKILISNPQNGIRWSRSNGSEQENSSQSECGEKSQSLFRFPDV